MEQSLERRNHEHSRKMLITLSISLPGTHFFHWRVKSRHRISWFGFCLYSTSPKPFLSLAALALLPLLPSPCSTWALSSTWGCTRSLSSSSWAPPQTPELSSLVEKQWEGSLLIPQQCIYTIVWRGHILTCVRLEGLTLPLLSSRGSTFQYMWILQQPSFPLLYSYFHMFKNILLVISQVSGTSCILFSQQGRL